MVRRPTGGGQAAAAGWNLGPVLCSGEIPQPAGRSGAFSLKDPAADFASPGAPRLPVHLDPVAVWVEAFERHVGCFIVPFHDGDAISLHAFHQRAHLSWPSGVEAGVQERRRRLDVPDWVQRQVEAICVADDDSAVLILLSGSRVEAEIGRIKLLAAPFIANRQPEMVEMQYGKRCLTSSITTRD